MCSRKGLLAIQENFGLVAECGCGAIHITVGPVTIAVDAQSLCQLHAMLGAALEQLESTSAELVQPRPHLMHESHLALRKILKTKH